MKNKILLLSLIISLFSINLFSQNAPETYIGSASACPGTNITVPVFLIYSPVIGSISLRIDYDGTVLSFINPPLNVDSVLSNSGTFAAVQDTISGNKKRLMMSWVDANGQGVLPSTEDTTLLCNLRFHYYGGFTYLTFNNSADMGGDCEYGDSAGIALNDLPSNVYFFNDSVYFALPPNKPDTIIGDSLVCLGIATTFSTTNVSGVTYIWNNSCNFPETSNVDSIVYNPVIGSVSGVISVISSNSCGSSFPKTFFVTVYEPSIAGLSVVSSSSQVCQGNQDTLNINGGLLGTNALWRWYSGTCGGIDTVDTGVSIIQTLNITTTYYVRAEGSCNTTACVSIIVVVNNLPLIPAGIIGMTNPCKNTTATFSILPGAGDTSYTWTAPAGWTGSSSGNSITFFTGPASSGYLQVYASNTCGNGLPDSIYVIVSDTVPQKPDSLTGPNISCQGSVQTYSVTNVPGVTYYWTLPSDWAGSSYNNSITVKVGFIPGNIIIIPGNGCGYGQPDTLWAKSDFSIPSSAGQITGRPYVSTGNEEIYSVINVLGVTYNWTEPSDWYAIGDSLTNAVTLRVGMDSGLVSVIPSNTCGNGPPSSFAILGFHNGINNIVNSYELIINNYPNPFNNNTTIEYYLHQSGDVKLSFFDILGENVFNINEGKKLAGSYKIDLITNFSSGIYNCTIELNSGKNIYRKTLSIIVAK